MMGWSFEELIGDSKLLKIELADGIKEIQKDKKGWEFTKRIEKSTKELLQLIEKYKNSPTQDCLNKAKKLLIDIEYWKANCMEEQAGFAKKNMDNAIWKAFYDASKAKYDNNALLSIMSLHGFGAVTDPDTNLRRAKRATAVMRFIDPKNWGVVDWRTIAINNLLEKHKMDVEKAFREALKINPKEFKETAELVNEIWAIDMVNKYRMMRNKDLPRAADVDMALFGLSLMVWPMRKR